MAREPGPCWLHAPLAAARSGSESPNVVDLQNGEMYSGHLVSCHSWMNISLQWGDVHAQEQG